MKLAMILFVSSICIACSSSGSSGGGGASALATCATTRYSLDTSAGCPEATSRATTPSVNGAWIAAADDGSSFVRDSGGGGGNDHFYRYDSSSNFSNVSGLIPNMTYGGDIVAIGNSIYAVGTDVVSSTATTSIVSFNDGDSSSTTIFATTSAPYFDVMGVLNANTMFIGAQSTTDPVYQAVLGDVLSTVLASFGTQKIFVDRINQRIYFLNSQAADTISYVTIANPTIINTLATITDTGTNIFTGLDLFDLTTDGSGNVYVACRLASLFPPDTACHQGSVIRISPDGTQIDHLISGSNYVQALSYRISSNQLYTLMSTNSSPSGTYSLEVMNMNP